MERKGGSNRENCEAAYLQGNSRGCELVKSVVGFEEHSQQDKPFTRTQNDVSLVEMPSTKRRKKSSGSGSRADSSKRKNSETTAGHYNNRRMTERRPLAVGESA